MTRMTTRSRAPRASAAAALATTALLLAGCGAEGLVPTRTVTVQPGDAPSSEPIAPDRTSTGPGRALDQAELDELMPDPEEIGPGWGQDPRARIVEVQARQVDPSRCAGLLQKGPGWDEIRKTERGRAQANYAETSSTDEANPYVGNVMGIWAYSFDDPYPDALFDDAGGLVAECENFQLTQRIGTTNEYRTSSLAMPSLGDRAVSMRFTIEQTTTTLTIDYVVVKVGHTTFAVANATYEGEPDLAVTEQAVRAVLRRTGSEG